MKEGLLTSSELVLFCCCSSSGGGSCCYIYINIRRFKSGKVESRPNNFRNSQLIDFAPQKTPALALFDNHQKKKERDRER